MSNKNILHTSFFSTFKDYFLISVGLLAYVMGWSIFLLPNNLVGGGVSGMSAIIYYATNFAIPMDLSYLVINVLLLGVSFALLGKGCSFKTIYAILLTTLLFKFVPDLIPQEFIQEFADNGKMVCTLIGGVLAGLGISISIGQGGSTGGTDILALVICKYHQASPGRMILYIDLLIILSAFIAPSYTKAGELLTVSEKLAVCVYGLVLITVSGLSVDMFLSGAKQSVQVMIFTKKYEQMADAIAFDMKRGVTIIPAKGWYSKYEGNVVMVVIRKVDLNLLLKYVKSIDADAFLSVSTVMDVYGKGFDTIKIKSSKAAKSKKAEKAGKAVKESKTEKTEMIENTEK